MKERIRDTIFNIFAKPFGIHRERKGNVVIETFEKREGWLPLPTASAQKTQQEPGESRAPNSAKGNSRERVEESDDKFTFIRSSDTTPPGKKPKDRSPH